MVLKGSLKKIKVEKSLKNSDVKLNIREANEEEVCFCCNILITNWDIKFELYSFFHSFILSQCKKHLTSIIYISLV